MRIIFYFSGKKVEYSRENGNGIRDRFISFFKKAFKAADDSFYNFLFSSKRAKPYVFSPFLGKDFSAGIIGPHISLIFSSGDFKVVSHLWNGILKLKEGRQDYIEINNVKFYLKDLKLEKPKKIKSNKVLFQTTGISILTDPSVNKKNFKEWFIIPEKDNIEKFNEVLNKRVNERYEFITGVQKDWKIRFQFNEKEEMKEVIVPFYEGYLRGFKGSFILEGACEILQFIYDYGFGVRTGQGFGLLEIIKEG